MEDSPDLVSQKYASLGAKISIRVLDDATILVEGRAMDLQFLGELLIAQARFDKDCGFEISPSGAGRTLFDEASTHGLYIHRTDDCQD